MKTKRRIFKTELFYHAFADEVTDFCKDKEVVSITPHMITIQSVENGPELQCHWIVVWKEEVKQ